MFDDRPGSKTPAFGIAVTPTADDHAGIVAQVLAAERGGLELVGIQEHPYQRRFLDTFALIADLLARTERLRFFPDVASLPMRPPAMLAKAAVSLDVMSGGRFELGIGAGAFWDAISGMGGSVRGPGERLGALEEAIAIVRAALDAGPDKRVVRGIGPHYPIPGYPAGPAPAHRVSIWVGAMAPRALGLIGRVADGWIPGGGTSRMAELPALGARIDESALEADRDPGSILRILNTSGTITDGAVGSGPLDGPVDKWVDTLLAWTRTMRIDALIVWPPDAGTAMVERLAAEVVPAVRASLDPDRA
jgi:alkanesulfonate monooxygenase SsuD/methylene tetrahydromethanopterin reductase-like flavin-dependent oxidoreductase (luciferase family)